MSILLTLELIWIKAVQDFVKVLDLDLRPLPKVSICRCGMEVFVIEIWFLMTDLIWNKQFKQHKISKFVTLTIRYQVDPFSASVDIDYGDGAA